MAGVTGVSGTLGAGVESPFCSLLFRFFPGVSIVESAAGLYVLTSLRKRNDGATGKENALRLALLLCLFFWGGGGEGSSSQELSFTGVISVNRPFPNSCEQRHKNPGNFSGPTSNIHNYSSSPSVLLSGSLSC